MLLGQKKETETETEMETEKDKHTERQRQRDRYRQIPTGRQRQTDKQRDGKTDGWKANTSVYAHRFSSSQDAHTVPTSARDVRINVNRSPQATLAALLLDDHAVPAPETWTAIGLTFLVMSGLWPSWTCTRVCRHKEGPGSGGGQRKNITLPINSLFLKATKVLTWKLEKDYQ